MVTLYGLNPFFVADIGPRFFETGLDAFGVAQKFSGRGKIEVYRYTVKVAVPEGTRRKTIVAALNGEGWYEKKTLVAAYVDGAEVPIDE